MATPKINLSNAQPNAGTSAPKSAGPASVPSTGQVWTGNPKPWPGSYLDQQAAGSGAGAGDPTGGNPPPLPPASGAQVPGGGGGGSLAPAFDRPIPVIVMGPKPLLVSIEGGSATSPPKPEPEEPNKLQKYERRATAVVRGTGQVTAGLADNRVMPAFTKGVEAASFVLDKLGPAGQVAGAALRLTAESVKAFTTTVDAFVARGRELAGYNANIASASARADVTKIRSDINEAQQLGPQFARLIDNQARAEATLKEILIPIKSFILNVLNKGIETGLGVLDGMLAGIQGMLEALIKISAGLAGKEMLEEVKRIRAAIKNDPNAPGADLLGPMLDQIDKMLNAPANPIPQDAGVRLPPLLGGPR